MGTSIYCNSSVGMLLRGARECCEDPTLTTKKGLAAHLGITYERLKNIEAGVAQVPFELAMDWCDATAAPLNKQAIKHIYGVGLPPTDPRLTSDVNLQLMNYIKQAEDGIRAAKEIIKLQVTTRPWQMDDSKQKEYAQHATEIYDMIQATQCVIQSLEGVHSGLLEEVKGNWLRKAISESVVVRSVDSLLKLTRVM
ncbi:sporulation sigma factor-processing peptidase [Bacillus sp. NPDC094106]|uniref:sporulation sigma factor-processing peptidase n=1 Tax=Bacillus sp. NPDC094106 TaxID=3363949 RepID=UPI0037FC063B